jgi:hypothetical protein
MFEFLNPLFLWGLAALAVPVLIHLLFRVRRRTVSFSSVEFILASSVRQRSRMRLREILLLLLRVLAVGLTALAFARPARRIEAGGGVPAVTAAVVLDDTLSMQARVKGGGRAFEWAAARAGEAIRGLPPGSRVVLVRVTEAGPAEAVEAGAALRALGGVKATFRYAPLAPAVRAAADALAAAPARRRRLVVLSDFQRTAVEELEAALGAAAGAAVRVAVPPETDGPDAAVTAIETEGGDVAARVAVSGLEKSVSVPVRLEAEGDKGVPGGKLRFPADGARLARFAGAAKAGTALTVRLMVRDALAADDARYLVPGMRRRLRVLCVEEETPAGGGESVSRFVRTALCPAGARTGGCERYGLSLTSRAKLDAKAVEGADVMVLCDLPGLTRGQVSAIEERVRSGAGCITFLGPASEPAVWNAQGWRKGTGFVPARLLQPDVAEEGADAFWFLTRLKTSHAALAPFAQPGVTDPAVAEFRGRLRLEEAGAEGDVLARFDDGRPALVARGLGAGRSVVVASTADRTWNDMALHKFFVPLVHGLVSFAAGREPEPWPAVLVGAPVRVVLDREGVAGTWSLRGPGGETVEAVVEGRTVRAPAPSAPGLYTLAGKVRGAGGETETAAIPVAANFDPREAALERKVPAAPAAAEEAGGAEGEGGRARHVELAHWFLLAALGVLAVELFVANRTRFH